MKLLLEIRGIDVGLDEVESFTLNYNLRKSARAVLFNEKNEIAILHVSKDGYHKLPGGGFEAGEDVNSALEREIMEEVGSNLEIIEPLGATIEYRNQFQRIQISYCYLAKTVGDLVEPSFDKGELADGFQLSWLSLDDAISLLAKEKAETYLGKFILKRDLFILKEAKRLTTAPTLLRYKQDINI